MPIFVPPTLSTSSSLLHLCNIIISILFKYTYYVNLYVWTHTHIDIDMWRCCARGLMQHNLYDFFTTLQKSNTYTHKPKIFVSGVREIHKNLFRKSAFKLLPISVSSSRSLQCGVYVHMKMIMFYLNLNFLLRESFSDSIFGNVYYTAAEEKHKKSTYILIWYHFHANVSKIHSNSCS